jgi:hypothetical protein
MPEHDQPPAGEVVFGVSDRSLDLLPVPLHLLADFPPVFLDHVRSGDWPLYALPFDGAHAVACWVEIEHGECPVFFVDDSLIEGSAAVRVALRVLVDRVLDTEAERVRYMRLPADVGTAAYGCPDCLHLPGCGCDCCPYPLPAVVGAEQLVGGVR